MNGKPSQPKKKTSKPAPPRSPAAKPAAKKAGAPPKPAAKKGPPKPRLAAKVDGKELGEAEARALWEAFSAWMDEHTGDMAGFARERGYASIAPTYDNGRAVLAVATR